MPTKCSVKGCGSFLPMPGKSFFSLPAIWKFKYSLEKVELSKKRRKLWLEAIGLQDDPAMDIKVCSDHFLSGRPALLENSKDIDWVPSLHMKLPNILTGKKLVRTPDDQVKKRKRISTLIASSKDNTKKITIRKIDLKKLFNCKVLLDGNLRCTTFNGTNGSGLALNQKHGKFTSDNITLRETAINNTVLRIRLVREDLNDLKRRYRSIKRKRKEQVSEISSFGRQIKKKRLYFENDKYHGAESPNRRFKQSVNEEKYMHTRSSQFVSMRQVPKPSIQGKLAPTRQPVVNVKTLNRVIKKNDRDKIKVKFFPKTSTPIRKSVNNGNIGKIDSDPLSLHREILFVNQYKNPLLWQQSTEPTYYLKFPYHRTHEDGKLKYSFQKLVMDVKHMKLPGPSWKIKVVIRQGRIAAITFTNKLDLERSIAFSATSDTYKITIDNRPALLLGSPALLCCASDLEILMDIVENIDAKNPMIFYK